MRIFDASLLMCAGLLASASSAFAQQELRGAAAPPRAMLAPSPGAAVPLPLAPFSTARDALRAGVRDYNSGDKAGAARALEFAAGQGHALALWKLGQMYSGGDGVPHDDLKAFEYFSRIADEYSDETPGTGHARVVSSAFVALGGYFLDGIKGTYVKADPARAYEMFQYAASYYGDAEAQFRLAQMHVEGRGRPKDPRLAARWLNLAAGKGHHGAQAMLGDMMVRGHGMPRQVARGLMWLTLAREGADPTREKWAIELHERAFQSASREDREAALVYLQRRMRASAED